MSEYFSQMFAPLVTDGGRFVLIWMVWFGFVVFNSAFNNISVISWLAVFLVEEIGVLGENHRPAASH